MKKRRKIRPRKWMKGCLALPKGWGGRQVLGILGIVLGALGWLIVRCLWRLFCFVLFVAFLFRKLHR